MVHLSVASAGGEAAGRGTSEAGRQQAGSSFKRQVPDLGSIFSSSSVSRQRAQRRERERDSLALERLLAGTVCWAARLDPGKNSVEQAPLDFAIRNVPKQHVACSILP